MTANATLFNFTNSTDLILEIPTATRKQNLNQAGVFSSPISQYQAYINELCLQAVLPWIQEDFSPQAKVWPSSTALPSFWEVVNGTTILLDGRRFILVPSESIDLSELRVPQEWVDIPELIGDYYLAVQVEPDEGWVNVWGYTTHAALKNSGKYDAGDRTYSLDGDELINDIAVLSVAWEMCPQESTKSAIIPLTISQIQAENLISRLANPETITPRLAIPFQMWGALLAHGGWRQSLYQKRTGQPEQLSVVKWLKDGVSQFAQTIGWNKFDLQPTVAGARSVEQIEAPAETSTILCKQLSIAGQNYELRVIPQNIDNQITWRFELRNANLGAAIPGGFKLRLLTEDLQSFANNEDIATTAVPELFVEIALEPGEGIVWEIEPLPEYYDREILKF
jgi:Protein of unknown function (DUF1822)